MNFLSLKLLYKQVRDKNKKRSREVLKVTSKKNVSRIKHNNSETNKKQTVN